jgi:Tol biopolymer transport system component
LPLLTRNTSAFAALPVWSPDGRKITFSNPANRELPPGGVHVYVVNADGSGQRRLARESSRGPAWSPDGGRIAFVAPEGIYVMNADGSGQRRLARESSRGPAWSPDGGRIAFVSDRDGKSEVYVMNTDGSGRRNLTRNPAKDGGPAWSPVRTG